MQENLLAIETTGLYPSVSVLKDGNIDEEISFEELNHLKSLAPMVEKLLERNNLKAEDLDCILMSSGPGSFTGIRIGLSFGKAFATALNIFSYTESSLKMLAYQNMKENSFIAPMLDGRNGKVFASLYKGFEMTPLVKENLYSIEEYVTFLREYAGAEIIFVGDGVMPNYQSISSIDNGVFREGEYLKSSTIIKYYVNNLDSMKKLFPKEISANYMRKSEAEIKKGLK